MTTRNGLAVRRRPSLCALTVAAILAVLFTATAFPGAIPSDEAIRRILDERTPPVGGVGIVVGIVTPSGRRIVSTGGFDGDTLFEIGSVTKAFTALLLADMVRRGEVALHDPASKYLSSWTIPARNGRSIELVDLATHTSGLPFMSDQPPAVFLASYQLTRDIGSDWEYSNLGYWLLGEVLTAKGGADFETLLGNRITAPLKLRGTAVTLSPAMRKHLAPGHDASLRPARPILTLPLYSTMVAAGGLFSSTNDLLTFLSATMGLHRSALSADTAIMLSTRRPIGPTKQQALGWVIHGSGEGAFVAHDGGTLGYASAVAWDPRTKTGVTVLTNQAGDVSDIAYHLLRPDLPLNKPATVTTQKEIVLAETMLDRYAGRYDAGSEGIFAVAREGSALMIVAPPGWGLPQLVLHPASDRDFFAREIPLHVTFDLDREGAPTSMLIYPPRGRKAVPSARMREK